MKNQYILTPFFLDKPLKGLKIRAEKGWILNSPKTSGNDSQSRMSVIHRELARQVEKTVKEGKRPVSIAGDCCTAIGVLAGLQRAEINPTLFWFDAHGDFNTWKTTPSGFIGGMPLAMLVERGDQRMPKAVNLHNLPEKQVIMCDGRALDPGECKLLKKSKVIHLTDAAYLLNYPFPSGPLWVHFDTDILPVEEAPAMNYPAHSGAPSSVIESVFRRLAQTNHVVAVSVSSWNPVLDSAGKSERVCMGLVERLVEF